jgi:hypothetical protein
MSWRTLVKALDDFFFKPQSPAPVCLLRIIFGILLLSSTLIMLVPDCMTWFGPHAIVSEHSVDVYETAKHWSLIFLFPRSEMVIVVLLCTLVASAACITLGLYTRPATIVAFICLASIHHRNTLILNSGDSLLRIINFLLILAPAGKMYSLDAMYRRINNPALADEVPLCAPWAQRLIQLQLVGLYCQAFWTKAISQDWISGDALFYATHLYEYKHLYVPFVLDNELCIKLLTWGSLAIEFALWTLIWIKELRYPVLIAGLLLHAGIEWSMNIPFFEWITVAGYLAFVEPRHVEAFCDYVTAKLNLRAVRKTHWRPAMQRELTH